MSTMHVCGLRLLNKQSNVFQVYFKSAKNSDIKYNSSVPDLFPFSAPDEH